MYTHDFITIENDGSSYSINLANVTSFVMYQGNPGEIIVYYSSDKNDRLIFNNPEDAKKAFNRLNEIIVSSKVDLLS